MSYCEPKDVIGECNAHIYIGDNFGDNHATMRCSLPHGHDGPHEETFRGTAKVTWEQDERARPGTCGVCGEQVDIVETCPNSCGKLLCEDCMMPCRDQADRDEAQEGHVCATYPEYAP